MPRGRDRCVIFALAVSISLTLKAQEAATDSATRSAGSAPVAARSLERTGMRPFSTVAIEAQATSLGVGGTMALPLSRSLNVRGGANLVDIGYDFAVDGVSYAFDLHLRTAQGSLDWFPFHGSFHISPGVLIYKCKLGGMASVPAGKSFRLGGNSLVSSPTDPIHGSASLVFSRTVMPSLIFGWGNIIPRSGRRWSFPFEIGAAYMGHNQVKLNLQGTACSQGTCLSTGSGSIQQDIGIEQSDLNESIKRLQAYPIISTGFGFRF
jgi:hypothetical protein